MKESTQNGLLVGFGLWLLTMLLGIPLGFLQLGYNPRYLLQLIFAISLLVRCCKKSVSSSWWGLFTLEGLVLVNAVVHIFRASSQPGFMGLAMGFSGIFGGAAIVILGLVSLILYVVNRH